ncbi:MAG TPA: dihydroorotase family protein [Candidatus Nitrosotalea sp.]|nr:dihydroorotase family protein [Candidatus Nitrosotalea sp.]
MSWDLAIEGASLIQASGRVSATIAISKGRVAAILDGPCPDARRRIDAAGLIAMPGMVDQHVHFMDPGPSEREDFISGSSAAAAGGVTTVFEHTHSHPVLRASDLLAKREHLSRRSLVDFGLVAHVFPDTVDQVESLWRAGAAYFKVFTCTTHGVPALMSDRLLALFGELARIGARALVHCEDEFITMADEARLRAAGRSDGGVISEWRSPEAEMTAVGMVCLLARMTGAGVTIAHASSPAVVQLVRSARAQSPGIRVESCPQYLHLNAAEALTQGPLRKFTPPARSAADVSGMRQLLGSGEIDLLATDHAPSTLAQKEAGDIWSCPFGLPGVETTLPLLLNACAEGWLSLEQVVHLYSEAPARLLGLYPRKGCLQVGADADLVLVDQNSEQVLGQTIHSRAGWSPYAGMRTRGRVQMTLVRGELVAEAGRICAEPGWGRALIGQGAPAATQD